MTDKVFEVLVFMHPDNEGAYGCAEIEKAFETEAQAREYYENVRYYFGKQLMQYESMESDASGHAIQEDYKENDDEDLSERSFSVTKIDVLATCEINFDESELAELNGLSEKEEEEKIREAAINSDMWRIVESEDNVSYEVDAS